MSSNTRLLITRRLPEPVEERAKHEFDVLLNPSDHQYASADLVAACENFEPSALLVTPTERLDEAFIRQLPGSVKIIASYSVGLDHIDLAAAKKRSIVVSHTPGALTSATADIAILCLLGAARHAYRAQQDLRHGQWKRWDPTGYIGVELDGAVLGIVGMGRIGRATAMRAQAFGMEVRYWNRTTLSQAQLKAKGLSATPCERLEELLAVSDAVSLHVPYTPETHHLIDADAINAIKPEALLINTARGSIVDDEAILEGLKRGKLAGIGFDVFDGEPDFNQAYLDAPNAYLLPHIGSATNQARNKMGMMALDSIEAALSGNPIPNTACSS